ncbi:alpha/beta fold hydrolase [Methylobacterium sp. E-005]|uniref:alpha/beta fold hydrolase n=1 Tax=Methylobacterium sp. E-005 TaxID=2836549 RepID=UPI002444F8BB
MVWERTLGRAHIIGIHGLANKPPRDEKSAWWQAAIREGLDRNCGLRVPEGGLPFTFVYWADLRYPQPLSGDRNREPYAPDYGLGPFPSPAGQPEKAAPTLTDRIYRGLSYLEEAAGLTPLDDLILEYRLDDLWGYYADAGFRAAARERLRAVLAEAAGDDDVLIAAHSMGGLIAYDVLRAAEADGTPLPRCTLVTLGSPLGLAELKLKLADEHGALRVPAALSAWTNLMDRQDIATVGDDFAEIFAPNAAGVQVRDVPVVNAYRRPDGSENRHKSYGYLRTPEFSQRVAGFLKDRS